MSTKPKDILILYLALALIAGVFYHTLSKKNGNVRTNREINRQGNSNNSLFMGD